MLDIREVLCVLADHNTYLIDPKEETNTAKWFSEKSDNG